MKIEIFGNPTLSNKKIKSEDLVKIGLPDDIIKYSEKFNGSWGIILKMENYIYMFTDPLGQEQLYYNEKTKKYSNKILDLVDKEYDKQYFSEISKWGYNTDDRTPWKDIKRVMPGQVVIFSPTGIFFKNIYNEYYEKAFEEIKDIDIKTLIHTAVENQIKQLKNVDSIGMLISGGIDSSIIAYELLNIKENTDLLKDTEIHFYTINNSEDAPFVKIFQEKFNIEVKTLSYSLDNIDWKKVFTINETPVDLGSMIPNQKMFEAVPETIIFTGDGPDEMFGGYRRIDEYDSQLSDIFEELSFYHLPRLNKAAMYYNKKLIAPYLDKSIVAFAIHQKFMDRCHKKCLKNAYINDIPYEIICRPKVPLKNDDIRNNPIEYRLRAINNFIDSLKIK